MEEDDIRRLAAAGDFAEAVRLYQERHGGSTEAALEAVQRLVPAFSAPAGRATLSPSVMGEIDALLRQGQKIQAIKLLRERSSLGLREAKDIVDRRSEVLGIAPVRSGCFIATAAYGEYAPELAALRHYRDRALRRSPGGRLFVRLYYRLSPPLAARLQGNPLARWLVRRLLAPLVRLTRLWSHFRAEDGGRRYHRRSPSTNPGPEAGQDAAASVGNSLRPP